MKDVRSKTEYSRNHHARVLAEKRALTASLRAMLDAYWGAGDGEDPPAFIKRAARLARWKHKPFVIQVHNDKCPARDGKDTLCLCRELGGYL